MNLAQPKIGARLVPLLDILFLLLAFFIIMPHGMRSVQDQLAPPPDWTQKEIDRLVQLKLTEDGDVKWDANRYDLEELKGRLSRLGPKVLVLLRQAYHAKLKDSKQLQALLEERKVVYVILQEPPK